MKFMPVVIQVLPPNTTLPSKLTIAKVPTNQAQVGRPLDFFFGSCGGCSDINHSLSCYSPKSNSSRANHVVVAKYQTPRALIHLPEFFDSILPESLQNKIVNLGVIASYFRLYGFR